MASSIPVVKSADRALDVLELIFHRQRPLLHMDIAEALGIPKSSLTPLLRNLVARRYLELDAQTKEFSLGEAILAFGQAKADRFDLRDIVAPYIEQLTKETDESCSLNVLRGDEVERVYGANSTKPLLYALTTGLRFPLYAASSGKILLALMPVDEQKAYLQRVRYEQRTAHTLSKSAFLRQLPEIRRSGVAYSLQESTLGIDSVSMAITGTSEVPLASVSIHVPSVRFNEKLRGALLDALKRTVYEVTLEVRRVAERGQIG
jgi:DNA-binding IclR family transcriptional regulator